MAGSALLAAAAAPLIAHWPGSASNAGLDEARSLGATADTQSGGSVADVSSATAEPSPSQWSRIPVAKLTAAQITAARLAAAQRAAAEAADRAAARRAAAANAAAAGAAQAQGQQTQGQQTQGQQTQGQPQPAASSAGYLNPLRNVSGLIPERVDMGVDFGGAGPVFAIGDGVITNATGNSSGWPGGGWITYRLTSGPDAGLVVYVAEDVTPAVQVGQTVTSSTVIGNMFNGGDGIETGWATSDGSTSESEMPAAGGISGGGPFPTAVGLSFEVLLQSLGVPAAPNSGQAANGILPPNYPRD